ncbi:hypothetical protein [Amycolatopsis sp. 195334CR]|uniref:hypothetical protein n=1 Tax=Amycolatopsis sp. 195334CR TaxID=2814588 RepID=UPI001A8FA6CB|nr:hypothetical protein [Amycolatopsis sp. 195334CR]MBN6034049.1 hypothetical protein [Amycolatopsis sp. 195334CR]
MQAAHRPDASAARDAAEFVGSMRRLKEWTGLTHRELARRAAAAGDSLPKSTLIAALGRTTMPRQELLESFVRACGGDAADVEGWVADRRRIAVAGSVPGGERATVRRTAPPTTPVPWWRVQPQLWGGAVLMAAVILSAAVIWRPADPRLAGYEVPSYGTSMHAVPAVAPMQVVGRLQAQHRYTVLCRQPGEEHRDGDSWLLVFVEHLRLVGFVPASDLPRMESVPDCRQAGVAVQLKHSLVWQHSKPEVFSQQVGDATTGTGRPENLRRYFTWEGDEYPPGSGRSDWCVVFDPDSPHGAAGFIACSDMHEQRR